MSLQNPTTYNPEAIIVAIDGVKLEGFSMEGVTVEHEAKSEITEGMDSGVTFEWNASRLCKVTISLRAASRGARMLQEIRTQVEVALRSGQAHPTISGIVRDTVNGSDVVSGAVFFLNQPRPHFADKSGSVVFELAFANYEGTIATLLP